jgi:hypothetical protein
MFREFDAILAQNHPYNSPRKAKVTLAFVGLLCRPKTLNAGRLAVRLDSLQPLENEVDAI